MLEQKDKNTFKNYVDNVIKMFFSHSYTKDVERDVQSWLVDEDKVEEKDETLKDFWNEVEYEMDDKEIEKSLSEVRRKIHKTNSSSQKIFRPFVRIAAAAVVVLAMFLSYMVGTINRHEPLMVENYVEIGKTKHIILSDGTKVHLNAGSLLIYPDEFSGAKREIFLLGEADFDVMANPDKPFIVRSNTVSVEALGTRFNVSSYSDLNDVKVSLEEGSVHVECGLSGQDYILVPGQQVTYDKLTGKSSLSEVDLDNVTAWRRGEIVLQSVTMNELFRSLSRKYGVDIKTSMAYFNDDRYMFRFPDTATLKEVLDIVKMVAQDFEYEITNNQCTISN